MRPDGPPASAVRAAWEWQGAAGGSRSSGGGGSPVSRRRCISGSGPWSPRWPLSGPADERSERLLFGNAADAPRTHAYIARDASVDRIGLSPSALATARSQWVI